MVMQSEVDDFLTPRRIWRREDILSRPSPIPAAPGVYGWWFDELPAPIDVALCRRWEDHFLLYTGISPKPGSTDEQGLSRRGWWG